MTLLVGQESSYLAAAQAGLVKAHVRTDVIGIEIEAAAEYVIAPVGVSTQLIAVQVSEILPGNAIHLRDVLDRQRRRLNLPLLKKPRTRR